MSYGDKRKLTKITFFNFYFFFVVQYFFSLRDSVVFRQKWKFSFSIKICEKRKMWAKKSKFWWKIKAFVTKKWPKIKLLVKSFFFERIKTFVKSHNFFEKPKVVSKAIFLRKTKTILKTQNFCEKRNFSLKSKFLRKNKTFVKGQKFW